MTRFHFFDKSADMADFHEKCWGKLCMGKLDPNPSYKTYPYGGFISKLIFDARPLKRPFLKNQIWRFCENIAFVSLFSKFLITQKNLPILSYTPYKYEVRRTNTHEMRAKTWAPFYCRLTVAKSTRTICVEIKRGLDFKNFCEKKNLHSLRGQTSSWKVGIKNSSEWL